MAYFFLWGNLQTGKTKTWWPSPSIRLCRLSWSAGVPPPLRRKTFLLTPSSNNTWCSRFVFLFLTAYLLKRFAAVLFDSTFCRFVFFFVTMRVQMNRTRIIPSGLGMTRGIIGPSGPAFTGFSLSSGAARLQAGPSGPMIPRSCRVLQVWLYI